MIQRALIITATIAFTLSCSCTNSSPSSSDDAAPGSNAVNELETSNQNQPPAPEGLGANSITTDSLRLVWTIPQGEVESFLIEQSLVASENWQEVGTVSSEVDTFLVTGLSAGTNYFFRVTAVYTDESRGVSDTLTVTTIPLYELTRGYSARACGLDSDADGTPGEAGECNYCDGVTTDPDGDSNDEDIFYVSSLGDGVDNGGCGAAGSPCATISHTLSLLNGTGEEDIICISGTFNESLTLTQSGKSTVVTMFDHNGTDIEVSSEPFSIIGWDRNNNGQYPPFDTEDTAVIDGQNLLYTAIDYGANNISNTRVAHVTIQNFSKQGANHSKLFNFQSSAAKGRAWIHDVIITGHDIGGNSSDDDGMIFGLAHWDGSFSNIVIQNIDVVTGGAFLVGSVVDGSGLTRALVENVSYRLDRAAGEAQSVFHGRGINHLVVRDSLFDGDIDNWAGENIRLASIGPCNKNWTFDNNSVIDVNRFVMNWLNENCTVSEAVDNMAFTRNHVIMPAGTSVPAASAIDLGNPVDAGAPVTDETNTSEDWTFLGNLIVGNATGAEYCFRPFIGNNGSGQIGQVVFSGNTCVNFSKGFANFPLPASTHKQTNYIIQNNLVVQPASQDQFIHVGHDLTPTAVIDYNVYTTDGPFDYLLSGPQANFSAWLVDSPYDDNSSVCSPTYEIGSELVYRLAADDTCARGAGTDITSYLSLDFEGDTVQAAGNVGWDH